jgi:hypothetical protein
MDEDVEPKDEDTGGLLTFVLFQDFNSCNITVVNTTSVSQCFLHILSQWSVTP